MMFCAAKGVQCCICEAGFLGYVRDLFIDFTCGVMSVSSTRSEARTGQNYCDRLVLTRVALVALQDGRVTFQTDVSQILDQDVG